MNIAQWILADLSQTYTAILMGQKVLPEKWTISC